VEVFELFTAWADKHVAHEESVVGASANDTDIDAVALVPAGVTINDIDSVPGVEVVDSALAVDLPDLRAVVSIEHLFHITCVGR